MAAQQPTSVSGWCCTVHLCLLMCPMPRRTLCHGRLARNIPHMSVAGITLLAGLQDPYVYEPNDLPLARLQVMPHIKALVIDMSDSPHHQLGYMCWTFNDLHDGLECLLFETV